MDVPPLRNVTQNVVLAESPRVATGFFERGRGMIGRAFTSFDAFILPSCKSVHTCFMQIPLDLVFLDGNRRVTGTRGNVPPWSFPVSPSQTRTVIELPAGRLCVISIHERDSLEW